MTKELKNREHGGNATDYVVYDPTDYGGFFRRIVAIGADILILVLAWVVVSVACDLAGIPDLGGGLLSWPSLLLLLFGYLYLTLLKRSHVRTAR